MKNLKKVLVLVFIAVFVMTCYASGANAAMQNSSWVAIQSNGQVVDSLTYRGNVIKAIYPISRPADNDTTYCCAAYVSKFYRTVYNISASNLWGPGYTPVASVGSFYATGTPRIGDIIRFNRFTHWAIVKSVNSAGTVTVIQQNARSSDGKSASVGAYILKGDTDVTYFTYSKYLAPYTFEVKLDIGSGFYATLLNKAIWKTVINNGAGNVVLKKEIGAAQELWKFDRLSNGSYKIRSAKDGKALDVSGGSSASGANIGVYADNGTAAQRWSIHAAPNGGYYLKADCTAAVMDLAGNNSADNTNIQCYTFNGTAAQIYSIYRGNEIQLAPSTLSVKNTFISSIKTFTWTNVPGETVYNLKLWKGALWQGSAYSIIWNQTGTSYTMNLSKGYYEGYVDSCNAFEYKMSNIVRFTVY